MCLKNTRILVERALGYILRSHKASFNRLHEFAKPSDIKRKNKTKQKKEQISESWGFCDHIPGSVWTDAVQKYPNSDSCGKILRMHTTFILIMLSRGIVIQILAHFTQRANCTKQKSNIS